MSKHIAIERETSLTELVREGVEALYRQDLEDLRIGENRLKSYRAHPERAISYAQYRKRRSRVA